MLPDGGVCGHIVKESGEFEFLQLISVASDNLRYFRHTPISETNVPEFARRHVQAFGTGTTRMLSELSVAGIEKPAQIFPL
jgi:hypothetical protein